MLIFSQQWAKAKLNYFKLQVRRCLHKVDMTGRCAEIVRRKTEFWDERRVANGSNKIVPVLPIQERNTDKKRREVQKRRRGVSFFRRDAKKLGRNAITSKRSALSFSLAMILFCVCLARAGQRGLGNSAATGVVSTDTIKPLQIGDSIPYALWNLPLQMVKAGQEGSTTVTLNDYKDKLIILDFWATWCVPCIKSLDKLDSLQKQFDGEVVIVPTTYEELEKVKLFLAKKGWKLPSLINDTVMKKFFPHRSIPHQVWLKDGVVKSIADAQSANAKNLKAMLKGEARILEKQPDVAFNPAEPLLSNGNGGDGSNLLFQSVLTGRMQADIGGVVSKGKNKILVYNNTLADLFKAAFLYKLPMAAQNDTRIVWEMPDSLRKVCTAEGQKLNGDYEHDKAFYEWLKHNIYCYNLVYPGDLPREEVYRYMQDDLNKVFTRLKHIKAYVEKRPTRCIVLKAKKFSSHLRANVDIKPKLTIENGIYDYRNWSFDRFVSGLTNIYARQDKLPVVDRTGIDFPVKMQLPLSGLNDLAALNQALGQYGISAQIDTVPIEMLVMKYIK